MATTLALNLLDASETDIRSAPRTIKKVGIKEHENEEGKERKLPAPGSSSSIKISIAK